MAVACGGTSVDFQSGWDLMDVAGYLNEIRALVASGQTTEHSFRPALAKLFGSVDPQLTVINEPKHITDVGAPDFVFQRGDVAIGWCEAKDIGKDVRKFAATDYSKGQKERYRKGLPNLIYTNGLDFEFISEGEAVDFITIADPIAMLPARTENFAAFENRLRDFAATTPLSIGSSKRLAEMMAGKAAIIKDIIGRALVADVKKQEEGQATDLIGQYKAFKANLIHDITVEEFADIYAETIAYGLFAARLHDETPGFNRAEALELLPKSNPFLRELFIYIAGPNLDERIRRVIDELCNVFQATDMHQVLKHFGKVTAKQDPFLHFYEVFLAEYNPAKRKARGVWYTPEPVVNFIVRAVDEVLQTEFGLKDGLADTSRISVDWDTGQNGKEGKPATIKKQVHRVQILDPATGTGTFLAEVVKLVAERVHGLAPGQWSNYVEQDLIPRIHGFELLMASYAMCHMKLDMILTGLGYKPSAQPPRLGVYLTNSLEEGERVEQTLFGLSRAIAEEAKAASDIKRQTPIMVVIGNPPYAGHSSNKGAWIEGLMAQYKVSPELKRPAQAKWLSDDYVKFIRLAEHMITKNGEGVLGFITNHSYLDNATFVDMRKSLLSTFDKIYVIDLHGNATKNEEAPDGSSDTNVFDIRQGVAIIIGVRKRRASSAKDEVAKLTHVDFWGSRVAKYDRLWASDLAASEFEEISLTDRPWNFRPINSSNLAQYQAGFSVNELFSPNGTPAPGIVTTHDEFAISWTSEDAASKIEILLRSQDEAEAKTHFRLCGTTQWNYARAKIDLAQGGWKEKIVPILYRPFDSRMTVYNSNVAVHRRDRVMRHYVSGRNIGLLTGRQGHVVGTIDWNLAFISETISDFNVFYRGGGVSYPLYLYPDPENPIYTDTGHLDESIRLNLDGNIFAKICASAGLSGENLSLNNTDVIGDLTKDERTDELKVFDYVYGVLHSFTYREVYREFLKIDFPRIPFPPSMDIFRKVSEQGETLRRLHLMEDAVIGDTQFTFDGDGTSVVEKPRFEGGRVWINADQYFENVPAIAWEFHIGGYQPAQKWLKDRKGRVLGWDEVRHYQKIVKVLIETDRIMHEIGLPLD